MTIAALLLSPLLPFWAVALYLDLTARRARRVADDIARIEAGFASWTDPTPATPLRSLSWPVRQSPTDMAPVYEVVWTPPNWAANELRTIVGAAKLYDRMMLEAAA